MRLSFFIYPSLCSYFKVFSVSPLIIFITGGRYNRHTLVCYENFIWVIEKNEVILPIISIFPILLIFISK